MMIVESIDWVHGRGLSVSGRDMGASNDVPGASQVNRRRPPTDPNGRDEVATFKITDVGDGTLYFERGADIQPGDVLFVEGLREPGPHCDAWLECGAFCKRTAGHTPPCLGGCDRGRVNGCEA
jgi:hypothetical protein